MRKLLTILSVLFIASPFAFSQVYKLEYMINKTIEPGNEFVKSNIDEVKSHNSTDKLAADFVNFSDSQLY